MKKLLLAGLLSALLIWTTTGTPATNLNNSVASAKAQKVQATANETDRIEQEPSPQPPTATEPEVNISAIPERVFCGSPAQRVWKTPIRENAALGRSIAEKKYGWIDNEWQALLELYSCESSWNHHAGNPDSGACGIPQSWPCSKLVNSVPNYRDNVAGQIEWGLGYIANRYGTPSAALAKHYQVNWY